LIRSKKFQGLSDPEVVRRYLDSPRGEDRYFLMVEIEQRQLEDELASQSRDQRKLSRHSPLYYLFYLCLFALFWSRFGFGTF